MHYVSNLPTGFGLVSESQFLKKCYLFVEFGVDFFVSLDGSLLWRIVWLSLK